MELETFKNDLPYRRSMLEADLNKFNTLSKNKNETKTANQLFVDIMNEYTRVNPFFKTNFLY